MFAHRSGSQALIVAVLWCAAPACRAGTAPPSSAPASVPHTFRYAPGSGAATVPVFVAGDFNRWSPSATPMPRRADGVYVARLDLTVGVHQYKFIVDGKWINDPKADVALEVDHGNGGRNSAVDVVPLTPYTFRYTPPAGAAAAPVAVAGDFNRWSASATPMVRGADGAYAVTVSLPDGLHRYKFVCNGKWIVDPTADPSLEVDDGHGGRNSGVDVDP